MPHKTETNRMKHNPSRPQGRPPGGITPYKAHEYNLYIIWKSLPTVSDDPTDNLEKLGLNEPIYKELGVIKTQKQFAEKYGIKDENTLSEWNQRPEFWHKVTIARKKWCKKLTPNIMKSFIKHTISEGDSPRVKLWLQYHEGWVEHNKTELVGKDDTNLFSHIAELSDADITKKIKEIQERLNGNGHNNGTTKDSKKDK